MYGSSKTKDVCMHVRESNNKACYSDSVMTYLTHEATSSGPKHSRTVPMSSVRNWASTVTHEHASIIAIISITPDVRGPLVVLSDMDSSDGLKGFLALSLASRKIQHCRRLLRELVFEEV